METRRQIEIEKLKQKGERKKNILFLWMDILKTLKIIYVIVRKDKKDTEKKENDI